jgi:hypothetical protein
LVFTLLMLAARGITSRFDRLNILHVRCHALIGVSCRRRHRRREIGPGRSRRVFSTTECSRPRPMRATASWSRS